MTDNRTDADLIAEAERLDAEATKGPWVADRGSWDAPSVSRLEDPNEPALWLSIVGPEPPEEADAAFIAAARQLLPELARRLKAAGDRLSDVDCRLWQPFGGERRYLRWVTFDHDRNGGTPDSGWSTRAADALGMPRILAEGLASVLAAHVEELP